MRPTDGDGSIPRGMPLSFRICPNASGKCATWSDTFIESSEWQTGIAAQPRHTGHYLIFTGTPVRRAAASDCAAGCGG